MVSDLTSGNGKQLNDLINSLLNEIEQINEYTKKKIQETIELKAKCQYLETLQTAEIVNTKDSQLEETVT